MKILILILSAKTKIYESLELTIRNTWASNSNLEIFYYYGGDTFEVVGDRIFCPYYENFENIGYKTIETFDYLIKNKDFDYIYRTNSSSYIDINNLQLFLKDKSRSNFYCGRVNVLKESDIKFASGSGYFLSKDLVKYVIDNKNNWNHNLIDDVALGELLTSVGVPIVPAPRVDIDKVEVDGLYNKGLKVKIDQIYSNFHFRCKTNSKDRYMDSQIMLYLNSFFSNRSLGNIYH